MKKIIFLFFLPNLLFGQNSYSFSENLPVLDSSIILKYPHVNEYYEENKEAVLKVMIEDGILASVLMSQMMLETGYGSSVPSKNDNNHTGMTFTSKHPLVKSKVRRYDSLKNDWKIFNVYENSFDCLKHYCTVIRKKLYKDLLGNNNAITWFTSLSKRGYAEDEKYSKKLQWIYYKFDLRDLDLYVKKDPKLFYLYNVANGKIDNKKQES